jgi:integrase
MASIAREPNGRRRIQFMAADGSRKTIRLGKVSQRAAEAVKVHVERLVTVSITGAPIEDETARWVANLDAELSEKLARVGLIRATSHATLGAFLEGELAKATVKGATTIFYGHTIRNLVQFFGVDKPLRTITPGDADDFRRFLVSEGLAPVTVARRVSLAKTFFRAAVRHKLVPTNPFDGVTGGPKSNPSRLRFITREVTQRILDACPDAEWRLLVALARYGGLRTPSESLSLRWSDIDWAKARMVIRSSKTEHRPGGDSRVCPIFPELMPYLEEAFAQASEGAVLVIDRWQHAAKNTETGWKNVNLRTRFTKIIRRAGVEPWPKLWHNLRASRETELSESFPAHVVCKWIGNSPRVAHEHYLQVTEEHFQKAAQNPAQQSAAIPRKMGKMEGGEEQESPEMREIATIYSPLRGEQIGPEGFEPPTKGL